MKLEYRLTLKDYLEATQVAYKSTWRFWKFVLWGFSIFIVVGGILDIIRKPYQLYSYFSLIFGICFIPLIQFVLRRGVINAWKNSYSSMQEPITIDITEERYSLKTPSVEMQVKWRIFTHFVETLNLFMVHQSNREVLIVPKRAFSTKEQLDEFRLHCRKIGKF